MIFSTQDTVKRRAAQAKGVAAEKVGRATKSRDKQDAARPRNRRHAAKQVGDVKKVSGQ